MGTSARLGRPLGVRSGTQPGCGTRRPDAAAGFSTGAPRGMWSAWHGCGVDPTDALKQAGGAARWKEIVDAGVGRRDLATAVRAGTVVRRLFGTYALPETPSPVWLAAAFHARLSCVSLCEAVGLPLLERPQRVHLLVPEPRGLRRDDGRPCKRVVLHRSDALWEQSENQPVACAIDLAAACANRYGQIALVDAALADRKLFPGDLRGFVHTPPERRRWLIDHCDHEAQSLMESYARAALTEAGFSVRPQIVVAGRGHRDLLVEGLVVVELDGWESHGTRVAFIEDRLRDRLAIHDGKVTLRYTYVDLFGSNPADLVADVLAALRLLRKPA